jgi:hypothetical protein
MGSGRVRVWYRDRDGHRGESGVEERVEWSGGWEWEWRRVRVETGWHEDREWGQNGDGIEDGPK